MTDQPPSTDQQAEAAAAELAQCAAQFPGHDITPLKTTSDRIRYVALSRDLGFSPYAVITNSLDELCAELTAARLAVNPRPAPEPPANRRRFAPGDAS